MNTTPPEYGSAKQPAARPTIIFTTIGGVIPVCLAFLASLLCIRVSSEPQTKKSTKFLACLCITAVAWGIAYLFVYLLSAY